MKSLLGALPVEVRSPHSDWQGRGSSGRDEVAQEEPPVAVGGGRDAKAGGCVGVTAGRLPLLLRLKENRPRNVIHSETFETLALQFRPGVTLAFSSNVFLETLSQRRYILFRLYLFIFFPFSEIGKNL